MNRAAAGNEILSVAIFRAKPGHDEECIATTLELSDLLARKGYAKDTIYRQPEAETDYVLFRRWASESARRQAQEDPEVHRFWARMGLLMDTIRVYEQVEEVQGASQF